MVKIIQKHNDCIGCGACTAVCPDFWEMPARRSLGEGGGDDGKAWLKGSKQNSETGDLELEINEKDIGCNKEAAEVCPLQIIKI